MVPSWPALSVTSGGSAPALQTGQALGAAASANERIMVTGTVKWDDGGTHDIHSILWRTLTAAPNAGTIVRVGTRTTDLSNGPPARDNGTAGSTNGLHTNPASNTNFTTNFTVDDTGVAHGALRTVVWDFSAYVSGSVQIACPPSGGAIAPQYPVATYYNGTTYAVYTSGDMPAFTFVDATGTHYGTLEGCYPAISAAVTTVTFNNTGTNEQGLYLTPGEPLYLARLAAFIRTVAGGDFTFTLYEGTTSKKTVPISSKNWRADATGGMMEAAFTDYAASVANGDIFLAVTPAGATNVTIHTLTFSTANEVQLLSGIVAGFATRAGGAWTKTPTKLPFWFSLGIVGVNDGISVAGARPVGVGGPVG
jgi:hypothetical protein